MRKKLLASILTVCMLFTMLPTAAFAADEDIAENAVLSDANVEATTAPESGDVQEEEAAENTAPVTLYVDSKAEYTDETAPERAEGATYKTLKEAVEKVGKGDTIRLKENASGCGIVVPEGSDFTLDFAGFSYTVDKGPLAGSSGTESQCFQLLKDSTLTFKDGTIKTSHSGVAMLIQNYANLTLDRMTLDGRTMTRTGATYTMSNNNGTVVIEDSIIIAQGGNEDVAFDVCGFGDYAGANVTVKGDSKITGDIELSDNGKEHSGGLSLAIESGTVDGTFKTAAGADKVQTTVKGGTFSDIAGAVKYAEDGATLKLLDNVTESITIPKDKNIQLDLNGKTLKNTAGSHTITVALGGSLTVQDSVGGGTVDNVSHARAAILNNGTTILNGGKYDRSQENGQTSENAGGNSYYTIVNHGDMTINDGVTVEQKGHFSSMIENGYQNYNSGNASTGHVSETNAEHPSLTINGGHFSGGLNTVKNDDGGKLEIKGGTFSNVSQAVVLNWNEAVISGGEFTVTEPGVNSIIINGYLEGNLDKGKLEIKGGTFTSNTGAPVLTTMGGANHSGDIDITGGTINGDIILTDKQSGGSLEISENAVINGDVINQKNAAVTVTGGTVTGQITNNGNGTITVTGGTFPNADVSDFVNSDTTAIVTFNSNGGSAVATQVVTKNGSITLPTPTYPGYQFLGWYANGVRIGGAGDSYTVTGNVTLVAQWRYIDQGGDSDGSYEPSGDYLVSVDKATGGKVTVNPGRADKGDTVTITVRPDKGYELDELTVTAKNGDTVKLTEKSNGKFTFKMPGSKVTVEAVFVKENSEKPVVTLPFADVNKGDWFYDAVEYVYGNDLMNGTSATAFSPYLTTSRAMMLTMLARYDGVDTTTGSTWYEAGAVWAVAEGISDGTNLEADLTREQLVTMLWRYTGSPVVESDLSAYPDGGAVSDWAVNAMIWATQTGVITGNGAGALTPQGTATRAEVATILARFCAMER